MFSINLKNEIPIYTHTLLNGLCSVVLPIRKAPLASINLTYKVGSKNESPNKTGMAHLFEHLMFEGTSTLKKGEFDKLCSRAGGTNNAYTNYDSTCYYMTLPANQLELGLWLEADRMRNFEITQAELDNQKSVVIQEIHQTIEEQPYGIWNSLMLKSAYSKSCPYSWEIAGTKEHVASVSLNEANEFLKTHYSPNNATLVIAGDIEPDTAFGYIEKLFASIPPSIFEKKNIIISEKQRIHDSSVFHDNIPFEAVFMGYHAPGFVEKEIYTTELIANILGSGKSSIIQKALIEKAQVASRAGAYLDYREKSSLIILYAFANSTNTSADQLCNMINDELNKLMNTGFKPNEIQKAKNQLSSQFGHELQSSASIAETVSSFAVFNKQPELIYEVINKYHQIKKDAIDDLTKQVFSRKPAIVKAFPNKK